MVDVFPWAGDPSTVSAALIMREGDGRMPALGVRSVGEPWAGMHTSVGSYAVHGVEQSGMVLVDRLACDLGEEVPLGWRLRLDHLQEMRLAVPQDPGALLDGDGPLASKLVGELHKRNRKLVQSLLSDGTLASIGLGAT